MNVSWQIDCFRAVNGSRKEQMKILNTEPPKVLKNKMAKLKQFVVLTTPYKFFNTKAAY